MRIGSKAQLAGFTGCATAPATDAVSAQAVLFGSSGEPEGNACDVESGQVDGGRILGASQDGVPRRGVADLGWEGDDAAGDRGPTLFLQQKSLRDNAGWSRSPIASVEGAGP